MRLDRNPAKTLAVTVKAEPVDPNRDWWDVFPS